MLRREKENSSKKLHVILSKCNRSWTFLLLKVVKTLCKGLGVSMENCVFALFEQCGTIEKNIEDRFILADVLAKFERLVLFQNAVSNCPRVGCFCTVISQLDGSIS